MDLVTPGNTGTSEVPGPVRAAADPAPAAPSTPAPSTPAPSTPAPSTTREGHVPTPVILPSLVPRRAVRSGPKWVLGVLAPALLIGLWELASVLGWVAPNLVPSPGEVANSAWQFFFGPRSANIPGVVAFSGAGWGHLGASVSRCLIAWSAAVVLGTGLGLALGLSRLARKLLDPLVNGLRAVPLYAWLPLALVWFGIGETAARVLIFIGALWPVVLAVGDGVLRVPQAYVETARMLGTSRRQLWYQVYLRAALPEIVTGLRLSLTLAWMCVIVGELSGTPTGVGAMMNAAREGGRIDEIVVGLLVFAVVGFMADAGLRRAARHWVRWAAA